MTFRKLKMSDVESLAELYGEVCDRLAQRGGKPIWRRDVYPTAEEARIDAEAGTGYVCEIGGELAGALTLNDDHEPEPIGGHWFVDASPNEVLAVHRMCARPKFQRHGVATALLDYAYKVAREKGMKALRLDVYEENSTAIALYERCGYKFAGMADLGLEELYGLKWYKLYEKAID